MKCPLSRHADCEFLLDRRQPLVGIRKTFLEISYGARQSADGRHRLSQRCFILASAFATGAELLLHSVESRSGLNALLLQLFNSPGQFPTPRWMSRLGLIASPSGPP